MQRACNRCGEVKLLETGFTKNKAGKFGYYSLCKSCRKTRSKGEFSKRKGLHYLVKNYGITPDEFHKMYEEQEGCCPICGITMSLENRQGGSGCCVDHCHKTNAVRGLLCNHCNRGLGMFKEDKQALKNAIRYLEWADYNEHEIPQEWLK